MRAAFFLTGTIAAASPLLMERQSISNDPNAPCGVQPFGYGPPSTTAANFEENPVYQLASLVAAAPKGYTASFRNQTGSTSQDGYLGYYLLETYNTTQCAGYCNDVSGCEAFNIYFERDPLLLPAADCTNPPPTTNIKCAIWSETISEATATNGGQYQEDFQVVIAGSDGFNAS